MFVMVTSIEQVQTDNVPGGDDLLRRVVHLHGGRPRCRPRFLQLRSVIIRQFLPS